MVPINAISTYSLLESPLQPAALVAAAKERGYSAVALTDRKVLYGAVAFYQAAQAAGLRPLLGLQATVGGVELTAYSQGAAGYQQLMRLSTSLMSGDQEPSLATLLAWANHLALVLTPASLLQGARDQAVAAALKQVSQAPLAACYAGIGLAQSERERATIKGVAAALELPLIAVDPVEYRDPEDYFATQVLRAIKSGHQIKDPLAVADRRGPRYLRPAADLEAAYRAAGLAEAAANTARLAATCPLEITLQTPVLPPFPVPAGQDSAAFLRQLCQEGLAARSLTAPAYQERLDHELKTIHQLGFDDYFLIVWDVMHFAHRQQITTGPGRGSAAGSLVAYALKITDVDPLAENLLFERFLNSERAQMPDIDLDLPDNRRQEVLTYLHHRYGHQRVAQIITFGTLAAKRAIKDVARVFMLPTYLQSELNHQLALLKVPGKLTIDKALAASQPLQNLAADQPLIKLVLQMARRLEGLPRNDSIHAAGIVLAADPLVDLVPLQGGQGEDLLVTQYAKETVEAVGLLKIDFLGLRNLSIIDKALRLIHQRQPNFDLTKIPLTDPATLQVFARGETDGIFQFESRGIRQVLVKLKPDRFADLVAVNALYRPGPLDNINHFIARKQGKEDYHLPDQSLAQILGPTYGILVYQEQVMQVAAVMAGFSLGQADLLRRAMSKKKAAVMDQMKARFIAGAEKNGYAPALATQVFDYIERFANYGFNRSHAVAYAKMAFQMAYLKVHFAAEFFTALLTIEPNAEKQRQHYAAAKQAGVTILGPRINQSARDFSLRDGRVVVGLAAIKGLRGDFVEAILDERTRGDFKDIYDFLGRLDAKWHKEDQLLPLIMVGAFDGLGYNRAELVAGLPGLLSGGEFDLGNQLLQTSIPPRPDFSLSQRLAQENDYLGVYLSGHPASQYQGLRRQLNGQLVAQLEDGQLATLVVYLNRVRTVTTKKSHQQMAFAQASDESGAVNLTIFSRQYQQYATLLDRAPLVVAVRGKVSHHKGELEVVVDQLCEAANFGAGAAAPRGRWVVRLLPEVGAGGLKRIEEVAAAHPGDYPLVVFEVASQQAHLLTSRLAHDAATATALAAAIGQANLVFQENPPKK